MFVDSLRSEEVTALVMTILQMVVLAKQWLNTVIQIAKILFLMQTIWIVMKISVMLEQDAL